MLLEPSDDQDFLRATTARFLDDKAPPDALRRLRDEPRGFDPDYWRQGAELGWTSLLVDEGLGGGSISEHPLVDLTLLAHEFGRRAAPGPLVPTNVVAGALNGSDAHHDLLPGVIAGTSIIAWAIEGPPPHDGFGEVSLDMHLEGTDLVLRGSKRPVEAAAQASHLLVTGRTDDGLTQVVVATDTAGVTITPMKGVDLTRRFAVVDFDDVRVPGEAVVGRIGKADDDVRRQLEQALVLSNAESVGAMQAAFDMTVEWAFDRYSFGRPLASYQALKHRFAEMTSWLEASHAISDEAALAVATQRSDAAGLVSAAKAYIGEFGTELLQECVQLHGGLGVTYELDLHLYLRRVTVNRATFGTPERHRRHLAALVAQQEEIR